VIILDTLLRGGLRFVLNRIVETVETEMNDEDSLREELLAAQTKVELGEMSETDFAQLEKAILGRLREIREARMAESAEPGEYRVTGIDASVTWDDEEEGDGRRR
jgi:hypothetical protein